MIGAQVTPDLPLQLEPFRPSSAHLHGVGRVYQEALALDWEAEQPGLLHYFERLPDFVGRVALVQGEVVGVGWGTRTLPGEWLFERAASQLGRDHAALQEAWLLNVLAVLQGFRRTGIGTALHDALLEEQPCPRALLSTQVENEVARTFYERRGWQYFSPPCVIDTARHRFVVMHREIR